MGAALAGSPDAALMRVAALHLGRGSMKGPLPPLGRSRAQSVQEPADLIHRCPAVTPHPGNSSPSIRKGPTFADVCRGRTSYARRLDGDPRSSRSDGSVVYHCPACFADRVGVIGRGRWRAWPDDRLDHGTFFECTGCGNRVHPCNVVDSVTATAFSTRMYAGATSFIASVVAAGDVDDAVIEATTDAVETSLRSATPGGVSRPTCRRRIWRSGCEAI